MEQEIDKTNIINLTFEDHDKIAIKMSVTVPRTYESVPSIHHVFKTFQFELDSLVEKVTAYIRDEAIKCEESNKENCIDDDPIPCLIPIKKKVRFRKGKKEMCPKCSKLFHPDYLIKFHQDLCNNTSEKCSCPHCGKLYSNSATLQSHIRDYHSEKIFMCEICDYQGKTLSRLKEHMSRCHGKKEKVPCPSCGKFILKVEMRHHHYHYHNEERQKKVPCSLCGKEFKKRQLMQHMKSVHAPRPFPCDLCEYKARDKFNLRLHVSKMHLGVKDLPKEKCQYCGNETTNLQHHIKLYHRDL